MKCDKLKPLKNIECAFNTTTQQEQVIAEDSEGNCYGFDSWEEVYLKDEVDAAIAELKAKLESEKAIHYAEMVDAGMRERRLKRALWIARAERYKIREFIAREEGNLCNQIAWSQYLRERTYNQWVAQLLRIANLANKLQNKCRAKAEEFK